MCYIVLSLIVSILSEDLNSLYLAMIWVSNFFILSRLTLFLKIKVVMPCLIFLLNYRVKRNCYIVLLILVPGVV